MILDITKYLTEEQRRKACEATYRVSKINGRRYTENHQSPIDVALGYDGITLAPHGDRLADLLISLGQADDTLNEVKRIKEASRQYHDWWFGDAEPKDLYQAFNIRPIS